MTVLTLEFFLVVAGLYLAAMAIEVAADAHHPHRWGSAVFWGLLAGIFLVGKLVPPVAVGYAVLAMALLAGCRQVAPPTGAGRAADDRGAEAARLGNRLLGPVMLIPILVVGGSYLLEQVRFGGWRLVEPKQATQVALGIACLVGLGLSLRVTRARPVAALAEGSRLIQAMGWAMVLPQLLASLGGIFSRAGVGDVVAQVVGGALPTHHPLVAVVAYCAGMALFTIVMGNAFAAFPVITLGIGLPFIVQQHGGNPAIMGALGMLSGYCGTLVTPMAANFNLVPAILLELEDKHAVIKAQAPMAAVIWLFNVALMYACVYRF
jgi:uncharacterized membrane protein